MHISLSDSPSRTLNFFESAFAGLFLAATMNDMIAKQEGEKIKRENDSKIEWTRVNAKEVTTYDIDDIKNLRLKQLTEKVADLCDLQPTPASMVRPPRKEMLKELRGELAQALVDAEAELEAMGGSVSAASMISAKTAKSKAASVKSAATAKSAASTAKSAAAAPAAAAPLPKLVEEAGSERSYAGE